MPDEPKPKPATERPTPPSMPKPSEGDRIRKGEFPDPPRMPKPGPGPIRK